MWQLLEHEKRTAIIDDAGIKYSYKDLFNLSRTFVSHIEKRCLVFLECKNKIESLAAYVGMINERIIPMMLGREGIKRIDSLADAYKPLYICMYESNICTGYHKVCSFQELNIYKRDKVVNYPIYDELALLLSTSGTTGSEKCVRLSYENLRVNAESIIDYLKITENDVTVTSMPMSYTYGLSIINTYLQKGAMILLTERSMISKSFWDIFDIYGITSFSGVPYTYEVLKKTGFLNRQYKSLRTLTQAGGKLREDLQVLFGKYAQENDIDFYIMYGQTEATARISYLPSRKVMDKKGSVGIAVPGGKISISGEAGEIPEPYKEGEIIYMGKNVSMGYSEDYRELMSGDINEGILHTGDTGYKDSDGYLYITGRKNRIAKINGYRVNLYEIENTLSELYGCEFRCTSDEKTIQIMGQIKGDIADSLHDKTGIDKRFIRYEYIEVIPRNENGK